MTDFRPKPVALIILDGWGYSDINNNNAIAKANKPNWDKLWKQYPNTLIKGSGADVGLPSGQMGNSEVGHLNIGAGRVVYQEFTRVSRSIRTGSFFSNNTLTDAIDFALENNKSVHVLGLLSDGGVHSHENHIHAMMKLAITKGVEKLYLHAFLDGRDTAPQCAMKSLEKMHHYLNEQGKGHIASIVGRYYAMDRDHRWDRIKTTYDLITDGKSKFSAKSAAEALNLAYERGETDEFVQATSIANIDGSIATVEDGDVIIFMNYRSDRARQITRPFISNDFDCFTKDRNVKLGRFVSLTEYSANFDVPVAFPPERLNNVYGEYISKFGLRQLRIAETEKYAHVTFFFNGGAEEPFEYEERILIPSPNVATYDLQPEMNAPELTKKLIEAINTQKYDSIICNFANPDMVGHTGKLEPTIKAIEAVDRCLGMIVKAIQDVGGELLITADHGNAEKMLNDETGQPHTAHTINPVPLIYIGRKAEIASTGALSDIAPTMLTLLGLDIPEEMNGRSLLNFQEINL
ncbi:MAG: 2,3-bisphosphoglycerate-independent phosphoglycerate mutase [Gammaproteobacteria bacterium]|nr:2,3-bisphosphoglycerate-independent phosphoglycerate mutase [Gammaproteobacteria bacterium]